MKEIHHSCETLQNLRTPCWNPLMHPKRFETSLIPHWTTLLKLSWKPMKAPKTPLELPEAQISRTKGWSVLKSWSVGYPLERSINFSAQTDIQFYRIVLLKFWGVFKALQNPRALKPPETLWNDLNRPPKLHMKFMRYLPSDLRSVKNFLRAMENSRVN